MKEIALPTTDFTENAVVNVSRVFAVLWCIAQNIYRKGEQRTMKMIENEMNVTVLCHPSKNKHKKAPKNEMNRSISLIYANLPHLFHGLLDNEPLPV